MRGASRSSVSDGLLIKDGSIIARMLSSPDTLIYLCMRKDNYDRAYQVRDTSVISANYPVILDWDIVGAT